jgi:hypothetical protein
MRAMLRRVESESVLLSLAIELDSDPITGLVIRAGGAPRRFSGWIDLAEVIEQARGAGRRTENSGVDPWGEAAAGPLT